MEQLWAAETAARTSGDGGYWHFVLIVAAIGFLGFFARWRKSRAPVVPPARELREREEDPNRYRDAADRAIVELLETSRSLNAQVDTKIRMLNRLVKDAQESCVRLEELLAAVRAREDGPATGGVPAPGAASASKEDATGDQPEAAPERVFLSELHERIFRLASEGRSVAEIARATNLSITEVDFIISTF